MIIHSCLIWPLQSKEKEVAPLEAENYLILPSEICKLRLLITTPQLLWFEWISFQVFRNHYAGIKAREKCFVFNILLIFLKIVLESTFFNLFPLWWGTGRWGINVIVLGIACLGPVGPTELLQLGLMSRQVPNIANPSLAYLELLCSGDDPCLGQTSWAQQKVLKICHCMVSVLKLSLHEAPVSFSPGREQGNQYSWYSLRTSDSLEVDLQVSEWK